MQSDTNGGERFIAAYVCRETPWWFAIKEVVADLRGIYYVRTVDVGHKREMGEIAKRSGLVPELTKGEQA